MEAHQDPDQWDRLIESVGPESVLVVIHGWLGEALLRETTAEDVWQEALIHAWRDRDRHEYRDVRTYRAWLLKIAQNRIRDLADRVRAEKRGAGRAAREFSSLVDSRDGDLSALIPGRSTTPSVIASFGERARIMREALGELPDDVRPVVHGYLFEERPMLEIATELGIAEATAWYRFRKGAEAYAARLAALDALSRRDRRGPKDGAT